MLDGLDSMAADPRTAACVKVFGGAEQLKLDILLDFFRSAFNGDGDDGGSCIDGNTNPTFLLFFSIKTKCPP